MEHLLGSLRGAGFWVQPFFNEVDFMSWVLEGNHLQGPARNLLIIPTGSSFSGIGSKSLIPAFCRLHKLEVAGPDPHSASLARHKFHSNLILRTLGDVTPASWCYYPQRGWVNGAVPPFGQSVIMKLTHEGASIGIDENSVVVTDNSLTEKAAALAHDFGQAVVAQEFIAGYEVEVPLFCTSRPCAIMPVGISLHGVHQMGERTLTYDITKADAYEFWDFESKMGADRAAALRQLAEASAEILDLRDLSRVDFRIAEDGSPKVIDISTSPFISPHSSFAYVASACGHGASELPLLLVGLAFARIGLLCHPEQPQQEIRIPAISECP